MSALYLGKREGKEVVYAGKVGSGFSQKTSMSVRRTLEPLVSKESRLTRKVRKPKARWVEPRFYAEVGVPRHHIRWLAEAERIQRNEGNLTANDLHTVDHIWIPDMANHPDLSTKVITFSVVGEYPKRIGRQLVEPGQSVEWTFKRSDLRPEWDGSEYEVRLEEPESRHVENCDPRSILEWAHRRSVSRA